MNRLVIVSLLLLLGFATLPAQPTNAPIDFIKARHFMERRQRIHAQTAKRPGNGRDTERVADSTVRPLSQARELFKKRFRSLIWHCSLPSNI
jgi:hypothetical protein